MKYIVVTRMYANGLVIEDFMRELLDIGEATRSMAYAEQKMIDVGLGFEWYLVPVKP